METSTSWSREIRLIIAVVATIVQKQKQIYSNNNMIILESNLYANIPLGVRWGDVER